MKLLQKTFVMNADKCGNHTFTQIRREGIVAAYRRNQVNNGRFHSIEVFIVKTVKDGAPLPVGNVTETYEQYPGAAAFGRHAWSFSGSEKGAERAAMARFDSLLKNQILTVDVEEDDEIIPVARVSKGEVSFNPPPAGWSGTQKELAAFLGFENYKKAWTPLQKWLSAGILRPVGKRESVKGKRQAMVFSRA